MTRQIALIAIALSITLSPKTTNAACNVCHSKNPKMLKMHKAIQQRSEIDCFTCHKIGDKLMGKGEPKDRGALLGRRTNEEICKTCHTSGR